MLRPPGWEKLGDLLGMGPEVVGGDLLEVVEAFRWGRGCHNSNPKMPVS